MDIDAFVRAGYTVVRGAFNKATARTCREMIWALAEHGVSPDDSGTWRQPRITIDCPTLR